MSIPLDRLYHYIESVAKNFYGDTIIYRFNPHGSKKIEDLSLLNCHRNYPIEKFFTIPQIYCYDQEPLDYEMYANVDINCLTYNTTLKECLSESNINLTGYNIRNAYGGPYNIHDQCVLLHSELNSKNLSIYEQNGFVGAYYWSHALIAQDWFRYAQWLHVPPKQSEKLFLIYNRAWDGTREYRIKFLELLVQYNLVNEAKTNFNPVLDNNLNYQSYQYKNHTWKTKLELEQYFKPTTAQSSSSADFNESDYYDTDIEVVLETLFDDDRIHLTEKSLRPIALGHPFILCATPGSLKYLQNYGFKTFNSVFNEDYDTIVNHKDRLVAIVKLMKSIANWSSNEKINKLNELQKITKYNQTYFFSKKFSELISTELTNNLKNALIKVETTNTSTKWLNLINRMCENKKFQNHIIDPNEQGILNQRAIDYMYSKALKFQNKY